MHIQSKAVQADYFTLNMMAL